jgi:hypothetical protein
MDQRAFKKLLRQSLALTVLGRTPLGLVLYGKLVRQRPGALLPLA